MRKSTLYLVFISLNLLVLIFLLILYPLSSAHEHDKRIELEGQLVKTLGLTDICLFSEAGYTRHLSQADLHAPIQDHPVSLEHFPSGSLVSPPQHLLRPQP